jgi:DNA-binding transcriptional MerR regulator
MKDPKNTYTIKFVARQTGLKPYLIRSWEARYNAVCPQRSSNRRRCFSDDDIRRLSLLKQAVDQGHTISVVSKLDNAELGKLIAQGAARADRDAPAHGFERQEPAGTTDPADVVDAALEHITQLDTASLEGLLNDTAVAMPRQSFLQTVVLPIFEILGDGWRQGKVKIISEHMASVVIRSILWDMLRRVKSSDRAPCIIVATPVGHWHEIGALATALAASESGWRAAYFGPNLPSEEIVFAARRLRARALALSLCHRLADSPLVLELKKLHRLADRRLSIFIGGPGAGGVRQVAQQSGMITISDLDSLRKELEGLAAGDGR